MNARFLIRCQPTVSGTPGEGKSSAGHRPVPDTVRSTVELISEVTRCSQAHPTVPGGVQVVYPSMFCCKWDACMLTHSELTRAPKGAMPGKRRS